MTIHTPIPAQSGDRDRDPLRSRTASTLRLLILVIITGLVIAFAIAGMFLELAHQLTSH